MKTGRLTLRRVDDVKKHTFPRTKMKWPRMNPSWLGLSNEHSPVYHFGPIIAFTSSDGVKFCSLKSVGKIVKCTASLRRVRWQTHWGGVFGVFLDAERWSLGSDGTGIVLTWEVWRCVQNVRFQTGHMPRRTRLDPEGAIASRAIIKNFPASTKLAFPVPVYAPRRSMCC